MHRIAAILLSLLLPAPASALFLYGITAADLVVVDATDPSTVITIGPHGLGDRVAYLTWDPVSERLFGLRAELISAGPPLLLDYDLVEYDLATGAGSVAFDFATSDVVGVFELLEYVESVSSLVVTRGFEPGLSTGRFDTLDPDTGDLALLTDVGFDNDFGVYDDQLDILYVWDPNNTGRLQSVDLGTGDVTDLAPTGTSDRDGAFSAADGGIFYYDLATDELVNLQTTAGGAPITRVPVGAVAGDEILGLAFTPVPEPAPLLLLALGAVLLAPFARGRP